MTDPLFLSVIACIGAGFVLSYLLGRWHGLASAYGCIRPSPRSYELACDRPTAGDSRTLDLLNTLHENGVTDAGA